VVIASNTQRQARHHMANIKSMLEQNELLKMDLGPFQEQDEWGLYSLVLPQYGARIIAASSEQSIRGLRHGPYRPDLIIVDDVEDLESVKTREGRDKTYQWLIGDVIPAGELFKTKVMVVGNLLHEDSLLMRLKQNIKEGKHPGGIFRAYPLLDADGNVAWPDKYKTPADIELQRLSVGNDIAWQREFLLRIVPDEGQIIKPEWIKNYEDLPRISKEKHHFRYGIIAADLAISSGPTADYSAFVSAYVYGYEKDLRIYILRHPINERLDFPAQVAKLKELSDTIVPGQRSQIIVEQVGYQSALIQTLQAEGYPVVGSLTHGQDKAARLTVASPHIRLGTVQFAAKGNELLIQQLTGFGTEKHDDLSDSCAMLINHVVSGNNLKSHCGIMFFDGDGNCTGECFV
jgi:predicted phage terminase large subunit-like protein